MEGSFECNSSSCCLQKQPPQSCEVAPWKGSRHSSSVSYKLSKLTTHSYCMIVSLDVCRDDSGKTPLHAAASGVKVDGTIETVDFLLKHGAMRILNKQSTEKEEVSGIMNSRNNRVAS